MYCTVHRRDRAQFARQIQWTQGVCYQSKTNKTTGEHFSQRGHKVSVMRVTILEKVFSTDPAIRKERERYFILKMNTKHKGLNKIT